jgi:hypothetical protein
MVEKNNALVLEYDKFLNKIEYMILVYNRTKIFLSANWINS